MKAYMRMSEAERKTEYESVKARYHVWKEKNLHLNMARGKPGTEQLDLVSGIFQRKTCATTGNWPDFRRRGGCSRIF